LFIKKRCLRKDLGETGASKNPTKIEIGAGGTMGGSRAKRGKT